MRRLAAIVVGLSAVGGVAQAATPATRATPALAARLVSCSTGATAPDRAAVFRGSMPAVPGAVQMGMRFELFEHRSGGVGFHRVAAPQFSAWERSRHDPSLPGYIVTKRIDGLGAPGAYQAVVRFRWYDDAGRVIRRAHRETATCRQPDPRPDLVVGRLVVLRGPDADHMRYVVTVRNRGRGDAAVPFGVVLTLDGTLQPAQSLPTLGGKGHATVSFVAPACVPGTPVRVTVDPAAAIAETSETNNTVTQLCDARAQASPRAAATLTAR
jgi:hypothetical protein